MAAVANNRTASMDPDPGPALARQDWQGAHALCMKRLARRPDDAIALAGLARIADAHGNIVQAETLLARAQAAAPRDPAHAAARARLLILLSRPADAANAADTAIELDPADPEMLDTLGVVLSRLGRHSEAAGLFARATVGRPNHGAGWRNLAGALRHCGRFIDSEQAYRHALANDPDDAEAWLAVVGLRRQRADTDPSPALEALWRRRPPDPDSALRIGHALAKTAEDLGDRDTAMHWLVQAKRAKAVAVAHDPAITDRLYTTAAATWLVDDLPANGLEGRSPILIVGAPRTGTTLVDRILSSHRDLVSVGESSALSLAVKRLAGTRSNLVLDETTLTAARSIPGAEIGRAYLDALNDVDGRHRTIDKMPLNLLYAGIAHRALPDARIIRLKRHPLDAVLANWRQLFAPRFGHYDHNWSLDHIARWIVAVERLCAHWRAALPPDRYLEIAYEDIVADQEGATRRLLAFCGVDWDEACLRFHENVAPVSTASAVQVREPLHARSVGAWRGVARHLSAAATILRDAGLIDDDGNMIEVDRVS